MEPPDRSVVLGIDFGCAKTVVSVYQEDDAEVLENDISKRSTPSCVSMNRAENSGMQITFGESAALASVWQTKETVYCSKSLLGLSFTDFSMGRPCGSESLTVYKSRSDDKCIFNLGGNLHFTAEQIVGYLFREILGVTATGLHIDTAVIAVPSYFKSSQCEALLEAASLAGLQAVQLLHETSAAAVAYAHSKQGVRKLLVLDIGGGGGSACVALIENFSVKIVASTRDHLPGGNDFTNRLIRHICNIIASNSQVMLMLRNPQCFEILRKQCDTVKEKLSRIPCAQVTLQFPQCEMVKIEVTRSEFQNMCLDLFQTIQSKVAETVTMSKVSSLDEIIFVGGSSRIPQLRALVESSIKVEKVSKAINPDECVAKGAAIFGAKIISLTEELDCPCRQGLDLEQTNEASWYLGATFTCRELSEVAKSIHDVQISGDQQLNDTCSSASPCPERTQDDNAQNVDEQSSPDINLANTGPSQESALSFLYGQEPIIGEEISAENLQNLHNDEVKSVSSSESEICTQSSKVPYYRQIGQYSICDVKNYLSRVEKGILEGRYPSACEKKDRVNFRRLCKPYFLKDGQLRRKTHHGKKTPRGRDNETFPESVQVLISRKKQLDTLKWVHEGSKESLHATSLSSHRGINTTLDLLSRRAFWPNYSRDVKDYIRSCETCQRVNTAVLKAKDELHPVPPPRANLKQLGIDLITLPKAQGFKYAIVAIDYCSKFPFAAPLKTKKAAEVGEYLFEWMTMFGIPEIIIHDQGREFRNNLSKELYKLTGVQQRVTRAYNPQCNGQVERENQSIKCALLKVLRENIREWPSILPGVLFALRSQKQRSTGYSPYFLLFGQEPVLPVDFTLNNVPKNDTNDENDQDDIEGDVEVHVDDYIKNYDSSNSDEHNVITKFVADLSSLRKSVMKKARKNVEMAQEIQKKEYDKRHNKGKDYKIGDLVWRRNLRRDERKGDWHQDPWIGPYKIEAIMKSGSCTLSNPKSGKVLKCRCLRRNLKKYIERPDIFARTPGDESEDSDVDNDLRSIDFSDDTDSSTSDDTDNDPARGNQCTDENESGKTTCSGSSNVVPGARGPDHSNNDPVGGEQDTGVSKSDLIYISDDEQDPEVPLLLRPQDVTSSEMEKMEKLPEETLVLTTQFYNIRVSHLRILSSQQWLNDEIINAYLHIICDTRKSHCFETYYFNTFFWNQLKISVGKVAQWTKRVDIFDAMTVLIPIHIKEQDHWALCVVDNEAKEITYFDSQIDACGDSFMKIILEYLKYEHKAKGRGPLPEYELKHPAAIPHQPNSYDCGVFLCYYARVASDRANFTHTPWSVCRLRNQMSYELLSSRLHQDDFAKEEIYLNSMLGFPERVLFQCEKTNFIKAGAGFINLGNTCYLNACVQVLFHVPSFASFLEGDIQHRQKCSAENCLTCALGETYLLCQSNKEVAPSAIVAAVKHFWKDFKVGRMEDASEFLSLLLPQLSSEFVARFVDEGLDQLSMSTAIGEAIFGFYERTTTTCTVCAFSVNSHTHSLHLSVAVKNVKTLKKGLDGAMAVEQVAGYKCSGCKQVVDARKVTRLASLPQVLIIYLKRFLTSGAKINTAVSSPNRLEMKQYLTSDAFDDKSTLLEFLGQITHHGPHQDGGHYTAGINCSNGYFRFDDSKVTPTTKEALLTDKCYIMFYQRTKE